MTNPLIPATEAFLAIFNYLPLPIVLLVYLSFGLLFVSAVISLFR